MCNNVFSSAYHQVIEPPIKFVKKGICTGVHEAANLASNAEGPELIAKIAATTATVLENIPSLKTASEPLKLYTKEVKNFFNFLKGFRSVDAFVNGVIDSWRFIAMNVAGVALLVFSCLDFIEKFAWHKFEWLSTNLSQIPILGKLYWGGIPTISMIVLLGCLGSMAVDKEKSLNVQNDKISSGKIKDWSQPLDQDKIAKRIAKYDQKITELNESLIKAKPEKSEKFKLQLIKVQDKQAKWKKLSEIFDSIPTVELEKFRHAKLHKWEKKVEKINLEKKLNYRGGIQKILSISAIVVSSVATIFAITSIVIPIITLSLGLCDMGFAFSGIGLKHQIKKIETPPVEMRVYVQV